MSSSRRRRAVTHGLEDERPAPRDGSRPLAHAIERPPRIAGCAGYRLADHAGDLDLGREEDVRVAHVPSRNPQAGHRGPASRVRTTARHRGHVHDRAGSQSQSEGATIGKGRPPCLIGYTWPCLARETRSRSAE